MKRKTYNIVTHGGMGDVLLLTPSLKAIKMADPRARVRVFYSQKRHKSIFLNNPYVDVCRYASFRSAPLDYTLYRLGLIKAYRTDYGSLTPSMLLKKSAVELIAEMLDVTLADKQAQVFLTTAEEVEAKAFLGRYQNPILIHVTSMSSKNQHWPLENWHQLVRAMPEYTFIQIGLSYERRIDGTVDTLGRFSFRQAVALLKYAASFVGVNSSFSHATNAVGTPGVVLFGPGNPRTFGHSNNINLYTALPCSPCLELLGNEPCPYGTECMNQITVKDVKDALITQLSTIHTISQAPPVSAMRLVTIE